VKETNGNGAMFAYRRMISKSTTNGKPKMCVTSIHLHRRQDRFNKFMVEFVVTSTAVVHSKVEDFLHNHCRCFLLDGTRLRSFFRSQCSNNDNDTNVKRHTQ
jgi:hypothetical protein